MIVCDLFFFVFQRVERENPTENEILSLSTLFKFLEETMFGIEDLTENTIQEVNEAGGKINLFFKGTEIIAEIIIGGTNELEKKDNGVIGI